MGQIKKISPSAPAIGILPPIAFQKIIPCAAKKAVVAGTAIEVVSAFATIKSIVIIATINNIIATQPCIPVIAREQINKVIAAGTKQRVVTIRRTLSRHGEHPVLRGRSRKRWRWGARSFQDAGHDMRANREVSPSHRRKPTHKNEV